jgi:PGF-CTERM protein
LPAFFQVSNLTPDSATIDAPGEALEVTATITNTGDGNGTKDVRLRFDGTLQGNETVSLDAGEATNVTFAANTSILNPGESAAYRILTDDSSQSGVVSVGGETRTEANGETVSGGQPGFGIGLALVAIAVVGFVALRRRR